MIKHYTDKCKGINFHLPVEASSLYEQFLHNLALGAGRRGFPTAA